MMDGHHGTNILKEKVMKKILAIIILTISVTMVSCYEEYLLDYPYTGIYFSFQQDVRTFVVGEGLKIEVGASLGGVRQNTIDRNVNFILDPSLITAARLTSMKSSSWAHIKDPVAPVTALQLLPTNYYTMTPSATTMVIKSGWHGGTVTIKVDSATFLNDSLKTMVSTYVLPFYITDADADTILESKRYNVVGTKFENMLYGNYWHGGAALVNRPGKADTTILYPTTVPTLENLIWTLKTAGPSTLTCNGYFNKTVSAGKEQIDLTLKGTKIILSDGSDAAATIIPDGESTYNNARLLQKRKIFLKYSFFEASSGFTYHCTDTLTFRNRLRDGVNEWQDSNPSHYEK